MNRKKNKSQNMTFYARVCKLEGPQEPDKEVNCEVVSVENKST